MNGNAQLTRRRQTLLRSLAAGPKNLHYSDAMSFGSLVERTERGRYQLTDAGREVLATLDAGAEA